jgi:hypothetical protein
MALFDRDPASGRYQIRFRFGGKPFKRSLFNNDRPEGPSFLVEVDRLPWTVMSDG